MKITWYTKIYIQSKHCKYDCKQKYTMFKRWSEHSTHPKGLVLLCRLRSWEHICRNLFLEGKGGSEKHRFTHTQRPTFIHLTHTRTRTEVKGQYLQAVQMNEGGSKVMHQTHCPGPRAHDDPFTWSGLLAQRVWKISAYCIFGGM